MISAPDFEKKQILFLFTSEGDKLSFSNDNIVIKDKDGVIKHQSTCYRIFMLFVIGNMTITSGLIQRAQKFGFTICLMNRNMKVYDSFGTTMNGNVLLRSKQYQYTGLDVGKHIIINKISNQRDALKGIRFRTTRMNECIDKLDEYTNILASRTLSIHEIMGIEGLAARIYFREMFCDYSWTGRKPRIKRDYINSTLDIGYTILFNIIDGLVGSYGFDKYQGVLHTQFYMRKSLVCDLVEPFRPLIDLQVRKSLNYGQCKEEDFERVDERVLLKWKMSPKYTSFLAQSIIDRKQDLFLYIQGYYRAVMKQKHVEDYPIFQIRG